MSCYVVPQAHVVALAAYAVGRDFQGHAPRVYPPSVGVPCSIPLVDAATAFANLLYAANYRSVNARYAGSGVAPEVKVTERDLARYEKFPAVNIAKMCHCLEYQLMSGDPDSTAMRLLHLIQSSVVQELPGYQEAIWAYSGEEG
jgi:hypothetical protein